MKFTAYDPTTGQILYRGDADDPSALETVEVAIIPGERFDDEGWVEAGKFKPLPARPSHHHQFNYTTKQWVDPRTDETEWPRVRAKRNHLLAQSDWTQLPDVPLATKEAWAIYRQALRDVTDQPDPFNIVWPTPPG